MKKINSYFAHTGQQADGSDWQPLKEHLEQVAQLAQTRAKAFHAGDWAYLISIHIAKRTQR
jgi:hypothetical protein